MNPTLLTTLSFLIFALTTHFPLAFTKYIYDTEGYPLAPGYKYYIVQTATSGQEGGALILGENEEDQKCPLTVLQEYCEDNDGLAVTFNVSDGGFVISEESLVEIEFVVNKKQKCAQSSKWVLVDNIFQFRTKWVSIGSIEDLGDTPIHDGFFQIKEQGLGYKFVFFSKWSRTYFDIKRYNDVNGRRLVATDFESKKYHPFEVKFIDARLYGRSEV